MVGNSSTRRKGWTNNVTDGLTFNTQIGGTVATSLFAVTTLAGFRCNTFVGADVAINLAVGVKVTGEGIIRLVKPQIGRLPHKNRGRAKEN